MPNIPEQLVHRAGIKKILNRSLEGRDHLFGFQFLFPLFLEDTLGLRHKTFTTLVGTIYLQERPQ